jgi:hypothetical protein
VFALIAAKPGYTFGKGIECQFDLSESLFRLVMFSGFFEQLNFTGGRIGFFVLSAKIPYLIRFLFDLTMLALGYLIRLDLFLMGF